MPAVAATLLQPVVRCLRVHFIAGGRSNRLTLHSDADNTVFATAEGMGVRALQVRTGKGADLRLASFGPVGVDHRRAADGVGRRYLSHDLALDHLEDNLDNLQDNLATISSAGQLEARAAMPCQESARQRRGLHCQWSAGPPDRTLICLTAARSGCSGLGRAAAVSHHRGPGPQCASAVFAR